MTRGSSFLVLAALAGTALSSPAGAQELHLRWLADLRLVAAPDEATVFDGSVGKTRYGAESGVKLADLSVVGTLRLASELDLVGHLRHTPEQRNTVDVVEAFARWRPVSTGRFRWTVKAGAFFPPISLENDAVAWTSPWTLTPSSINSWVGEELRTIGGEATVRYRGDGWTLDAGGAVFGWNDPAGILLAYKGWTFHDAWTGLLDNPRMPDEIARHSRRIPPVYTEMFKEIDDRAGWYAHAAWRGQGPGGTGPLSIRALYYNNRADPAARRGQLAWNLEFVSLGAELEPADGWTVLAQAMTGDTGINPNPIGRSWTDFQAAYLLVGRELGDWHGPWRAALRLDAFSTRERSLAVKPELSEHGRAVTAALTWRPADWLRITAELLHVDSWRVQRLADGLPADAAETQAQLGLRLSF